MTDFAAPHRFRMLRRSEYNARSLLGFQFEIAIGRYIWHNVLLESFERARNCFYGRAIQS